MSSAKHDARALLAERFGEDLVPLESESAPTSPSRPLIDQVADAIRDAFASRSTGHVADYAAEIAEIVIRALFFGHTIDRDDDRAQFIATMHGLIGWLMMHPDVPTPWSSGFNVKVPDVDTLERLAQQFGLQTWPRTGTPHQLTIFDPVGQTRFYMPVAISVDDDDAERPL